MTDIGGARRIYARLHRSVTAGAGQWMQCLDLDTSALAAAAALHPEAPRTSIPLGVDRMPG
ncbi:hypothetical protein GYA93_13380 [Gordonia desulfuricans]|uniref:Uncharacterized protein n=1 Tax=Gordonia desulfuricans TaxID=89051 RepID=A0A7K3LQP7_9ACTN|nr:hypothetical protein [Gordonia desulfuricans]NDK90563.1 hypothetical protein [Gordonia desulfuricans]